MRALLIISLLLLNSFFVHAQENNEIVTLSRTNTTKYLKEIALEWQITNMDMTCYGIDGKDTVITIIDTLYTQVIYCQGREIALSDYMGDSVTMHRFPILYRTKSNEIIIGFTVADCAGKACRPYYFRIPLMESTLPKED